MTQIIETQQNDVLDLSIKRQFSVNDTNTSNNSNNKRQISSYDDDDVDDEDDYINSVANSHDYNNTDQNESFKKLIASTFKAYAAATAAASVAAASSPNYGGSDEQNYDNDSSYDFMSTQQQQPPSKRKKKYSVKSDADDYMSTSSSYTVPATATTTAPSKKQMRFQCKFCSYKSHSVSLIQNHIYRHIDTTPYSCFYCGHKSTTKSTIMVHIELCHPNMDVKIEENRVKEEDYYIDLNQSQAAQQQAASVSNGFDDYNRRQFKNKSNQNKMDTTTGGSATTNGHKFEIIASKCHFSSSTTANEQHDLITDDSDTISLGINIKQESISADSTQSSSCSVSPNSPHASSITPTPTPTPQLPTTTTVPSYTEPNQSSEQPDENDNYTNVFNRPKQYFGSLYEPDKQYSCKLCTYTTNHKPSMEDHVYVHTNKRPYRCGYCNEEIYTRYAATYHNKYKHPGEARYFIKDEQDVSKFYVNRAAKKEAIVSSSAGGCGGGNDANEIVNVKHAESLVTPPLATSNSKAKSHSDRSHTQLKHQLNTNTLTFPNSSITDQVQPSTQNKSNKSNSNKQTQQFDQHHQSQQHQQAALAHLLSQNANPNLFPSILAAAAAASSSVTPQQQLQSAFLQNIASAATQSSPQQQQQPIFDYNLQLKIYQMYLQNLMTANLFQNLNRTNTNTTNNNNTSNNTDDDLVNTSTNESFNEENDDCSYNNNNNFDEKNDDNLSQKSQRQHKSMKKF